MLSVDVSVRQLVPAAHSSPEAAGRVAGRRDSLKTPGVGNRLAVAGYPCDVAQVLISGIPIGRLAEVVAARNARQAIRGSTPALSASRI